MTIKRSEVEGLLATVEQLNKPNGGVIAELCRTWLAVQDAPVGTVTREDWLENFRQFNANHIGRRVRLVADTGNDSGT